MNRRGFLKLMGLGGVGVAVSNSLFSAVPILLGVPDHYVFEHEIPLLRYGAKAHVLWSTEDGIQHLLLKGPNTTKREKPWAPLGDVSTYRVDCPVGDGQDPHIEFFMAANQLRDKINADIQEFAKELRDYSLVMITKTDMPIMAIPKPDSGFYLETQIHQFAAEKTDLFNPRDADSIQGDVPIEFPNDIEFKYLMLMQEDLERIGVLPFQRRREFLYQKHRKLLRTPV